MARSVTRGWKSFWQRWRSRRPTPEQLDARGWDLSLLGLVLLAVMVSIAFLRLRYGW